MSRFLTNMNIDPMKFHRQVRDYPYYIFATDFIYCTLKKCGIDWTPYEMEQVLGITEKIQSRSAAHSPHKLSPCSTAVQTAAAKILDRSTRDYAKVYNKLVTDSTDKLGTFREHTRKVLAKLVTEGGTPCETLLKLLYVGKLTAVFYEHGTTSAADLAPIIIATALREINGDEPPTQWFKTIDSFSQEVVYSYEIDNDFAMDVYISEVDSDEESSNDSEKADEEEEDCGTSDEVADKQEKNVDKGEEEDSLASEKVSDEQEKAVEEEDSGASENVSDEQEKTVDEEEEEDSEASDKVSNVQGKSADEEGGSSCEISDKREDTVRREREENPDSSSEGTGGNSSKNDCERGEKLSDSSELEDSCVKTDESSSDKKCSTVSDGCERAYDASCCSNEPEPED